MKESRMWAKYIGPVRVNEQFVHVGDCKWPAGSVNPDCDGRYGKAVYVASGLKTALKETEGKALDGKQAFPMASGTYYVFDQMAYCRDYPEEREKLMAPKESGGYDSCRALRDQVCRESDQTVSGIMYESARDPGGVNLALWDPSELTHISPGLFGHGADIDVAGGE